MLRPNQTDRFMIQATQAAYGGTCDRLLVGALLVQDGTILATGYNGSPRGHRHCDTPACVVCEEPHSELWFGEAGKRCPRCGYEVEDSQPHRMHTVYNALGAVASEHCTLTCHGELNTILNVAREGKGATKGATLYCTDSPCWECAKALVNAGVTKVVFQRLYQKREALWLMARHMELVQWRRMGPYVNDLGRTRVIRLPGLKDRHGFITIHPQLRKGSGDLLVSNLLATKGVWEERPSRWEDSRVFDMPKNGVLTEDTLGLTKTAYAGTFPQLTDGGTVLSALECRNDKKLDRRKLIEEHPRVRLWFSPDGFDIEAWEATRGTV